MTFIHADHGPYRNASLQKSASIFGHFPTRRPSSLPRFAASDERSLVNSDRAFALASNSPRRHSILPRCGLFLLWLTEEALRRFWRIPWLFLALQHAICLPGAGQAAAERPARPDLRAPGARRAGCHRPSGGKARALSPESAGDGPVPGRPVQGRARHLRRPGAPASVGASHTGPERAHALGRGRGRPSAGGPAPVAAVSRRASGA